MVDADDVHAQHIVVLLEARLKELDIEVDPGRWDADVEFSREVLGEGCEAGFQRFFGGYVDEVVCGADVVCAGDQEEAGCRRDDVEDGDVGTGFSEAFGEGETAATGAASDEGSAASKGELREVIYVS